MDTLETYIKMCEKAVEIQEDCLKYGKSYSCIPSLFVNKSDYRFNTFYQYKHSENIWLPRQDQLQEMVGGFESGFILWGEWLDNMYPEHKNSFKKIFNSFEQLWLAFVMKEKYNKICNGEDWIEK